MNVLIVEDDPVHRAFLKEVIELALPECSHLFEAEDGRMGERLAHEHAVGSVVMDLQMPARTGVEAAKSMWRERPDTSILFWSNYADEAYVRGISRIVPQGAAYGYVLKTASEERLRLALRSLFIEQQCVIDREIRGVQQKAQDRLLGLTDTEYGVLQDIALGLTDRTIAERHNLSLRSVQNRLQQLYEKLGVYQLGDASPAFNLRARAVNIALLRKLLNRTALEQAEEELQGWLQARR
ncbi:response regulator transcription factor [Pseudomonas typographi]|uniref:Response regulator transcription factor n=1 Tax=Pseudomonas typographi TaxID=2715964 RepID=A0ABR7Z1B8_9PSED|nr:response regulator transcription factor [Pseudomonas typographi]MBD1554799.1 response regulator transcription factor [Pseudomonas typographi]MBD1587322.1 response regulator transcription factor [Pseudomonas typographi]MBD1599182.1 response regulator transcription factor [Pseudomonas typographi]